ncbi:MAG: hypothetical protein Q9183_005740 [Haloplaca sp. 2 TL-2023]
MAIRMLNVMEEQVYFLRAIALQGVHNFNVNLVALKFIVELDHYLASLVTYMDKDHFDTADWDKYIRDWSDGLGKELAHVQEELRRGKKGKEDKEDGDQDGERAVREKHRKVEPPTEANIGEELKGGGNENEDQEVSDQGSERTVGDKRQKVQEPMETDIVSPSEPFFEAPETRDDNA